MGRFQVDYTGRPYWNAMLNASLCKFFILRAVCREPMHGYGVIRRVAELSGDLCVPTEGTVYPVLREFEQCGCVRSRTQMVRGRERVVYAATPKGRKALRAGMDVWQRALAHLRPAMEEPKAGTRRA